MLNGSGRSNYGQSGRTSPQTDTSGNAELWLLANTYTFTAIASEKLNVGFCSKLVG